MNNMVSILALTSIIIMLLLAIRAFNDARRQDQKIEDRKPFFRILLLYSSVIVSDVLCGGPLHIRLYMDILSAVIIMYILMSSLTPETLSQRLLRPVYIVAAIYMTYCIMCAFHIFDICSVKVFYVIASAMTLSLACFFFGAVLCRLHNVKAVMKSGTVWSFMCLCVDAVYAIFPLIIFIIMLMVKETFPSLEENAVTVATFLMLLQLVALSLRSHTGNLSVIFTRHENVIIESMKISQIEMMNSNPKVDELYKDVYERIVLYFEMNKPFLNSELTISDIVKVVYSNKVYISKAISHYTGRNFRQFVNYHRVMYSMDLFRKDPLMKVSDLAEKSGFNSVVSYTMSFRLFMNETPSDWCRKEKTKLIKIKK